MRYQNITIRIDLHFNTIINFYLSTHIYNSNTKLIKMSKLKIICNYLNFIYKFICILSYL